MAETDSLKPVWSEEPEHVLGLLGVDPRRGLTRDEVVRRRMRFGPNRLHAAIQRHVLAILAAQFQSIVVLLLVVAAGIAWLFADIPEALAIVAVIVINAAIGFFSEWRATRSMEALRQCARLTAVVLRDGKLERVDAEDIVPGDIVQLEAGDLVPADLRLIEATKLGADESTLTGESLPVRKNTNVLPVDTNLLERANMVFRGTSVTRGAGRAVATSTGMRTEFGRIYEQVSEGEVPQTPLEKRLEALGARLAWVVIAIGTVIALGGIVAGRETFLAIQVAIALSVAAIPEGLPIVATIALARGMWRMARRRALITRLSAVETLGATSVILTDKTGTLTDNRMTATTALTADGDRGLGEPASLADDVLEGMLTAAVLCNNASFSGRDGPEAQGLGDPTEVALLAAAARYGIRRERLVEAWPEVHEDTFDPDSKRMATVHQRNGDFLIAVKGAPETILEGCVAVHTRHGPAPLTGADRRRWLDRVAVLGAGGLRALAVADKVSDRADAQLYAGLVLYGVFGLEDPARDGVDEAIRQCHDAGVSVVMVTGDHADTARNIAVRVGIAEGAADSSQFVDGAGVDELLRSDVDDRLRKLRVVSRVTPSQKLGLIRRYQDAGFVVAMTGDGVNDAPALKNADIGIAMGRRGTEVAKEAAAMVLEDDDLGSIVTAIGYGRTIFANIRKFVIYLLSCNISEILIVGLATLAGAPLPLLPLQILFLNLVTDVFPALALGVGPDAQNSLQKGPRPAGERILMRRHWAAIGLHGSVIALGVLGTMAVAASRLGYNRQETVTVAFLTLALSQLWHVFNMRSDTGRPLDNEISRNPWIWAALALCMLLVLVAVYVPPLAAVMQLSEPDPAGWALILAGSLIPVLSAPVVRRAAIRV